MSNVLHVHDASLKLARLYYSWSSLGVARNLNFFHLQRSAMGSGVLLPDERKQPALALLVICIVDSSHSHSPYLLIHVKDRDPAG